MSLLTDFAERVRRLLFRRRDEREMQEELEFHVEMESAKRRTGGVTTGEARRQSLIALGGLEQTKEDIRDAGGVRATTDIGGDLRYAFRTLRARPAFSLVAIITIAVGIGATTAVFSTLDTVILQALPYREPGRLVRLYASNADAPQQRGVVSPVHFLAYRQRLSSMSSLAALNLYELTGADIGTGDDLQRVRTLIVSSDYFDVLQAHPAVGRAFDRSAENGSNDENAPGVAVAVLSDRLWRTRFHGDRAVIGTTMLMSGRATTIVGVMPAGFADPIAGPGVDAWVPLDVTPGKDLSNSDNHYLSVIARLAPGVSITRAQTELNSLSLAIVNELGGRAKKTRAQLYPLKDDVVGPARGSLELIAGAVGLMLLLVCVNIANLLLVRGSERAREFAMRAALGAGRGRMVQQLLTESLVLAVVGALLAIPVARVVMSAIVALGAGSIPRLNTLSLNPRVLAFSALAAIVSAVLFGLVPAWRAAQTEPADVLRRGGRSSTGDRAQGRMRSILVVSQVALAFLLLVGAGLLVASFRRLQQLPLGAHIDNVLTFQVHLPDVRYDSAARMAFHRRLDAVLAATPGVRAAGATSRLPAAGAFNDWGTSIVSGPIAGSDKANGGAQQRIVTPGYFRATGIPLLKGRTFDDRDVSTAPDRVVVSKAFADLYYPGVDPLGQQLVTGGHRSEVIGVVGDVAVDPEGAARPFVYHTHDQFGGDRNWSLYEAVATTGSPGSVAAAARRAMAAIDPQLVMDQEAPLADVVGQGVAQRVFALRVLLAFAVIALLLAALGVFGVLSYTVRLRGPEFGVRMALGATPGVIRWSVLRAAAGVTLTGIGFGLVGALAFSRVMQSLVFHVSTLDPAVLAAAVVFMLLVSGIAAYLPARRATGVDPRSVLQ